jgi:hypothetical protein
MSVNADIGVRFTRSWVARYTGGLSEKVGDRRRSEIESDLYEQTKEGTGGVLGRCLRGIPADLWWRVRMLRQRAREAERDPNMRPSRSRPIWLTIVAIHIVFPSVLGLIGVPNLAIGPSDNSAVRWTLTAIAAFGVALMIVGLIVQRSRFVSGSRLFIVGLLPSLISPTGLIVLGFGAWTANLDFSDKTFDLPPDTGGNEHYQVRTEEKETTMNTFKERWWRIAAGFIAVGMAFLGIGNMLEDDGGPLYGRIVAAVVAVAAAMLIGAGLTIRRRNQRLGSTMIGVGTLPATGLILFFWFPPVALVGVLAVVVTVKAFNDAGRQRRVDQLANNPS